MGVCAEGDRQSDGWRWDRGSLTHSKEPFTRHGLTYPGERNAFGSAAASIDSIARMADRCDVVASPVVEIA